MNNMSYLFDVGTWLCDGGVIIRQFFRVGCCISHFQILTVIFLFSLEFVVGERDFWHPHLWAILLTMPASADVVENILLAESLILDKLVEFNKQWGLEKDGVESAVVPFKRIVSPVHHQQKLTIFFADVPAVRDLQPLLPEVRSENIHQHFL